MREIVLRETERGWLPIIREQNDYQEWRETARGSFYKVTGDALDAAERMLDERDIIAAQAVPCNYKHEDLATEEPCPDCGVIIYVMSPETRDADYQGMIREMCETSSQISKGLREVGDKGFLAFRDALAQDHDGSYEYPIDPPGSPLQTEGRKFRDPYDGQNIPEGKG